MLVIDGSDLSASSIESYGIANDEVHFTVRTYEPLISSAQDNLNAYQQSFIQQQNQNQIAGKAKSISPWLLDLEIFSSVIQYNFQEAAMSQKVNIKCTVAVTKQPCISLEQVNVQTILDKYSAFEISFVPPVNGTYKIVSKHFITPKPFLIKVLPQEADE